MLRDARVMLGLPSTADAAAVRRFWEYAGPELRQFPERNRETGLVDAGATVVARVEHERWLADCPFCNGGIACAPDIPEAACLSCGHVYRVVFPKPDAIGKADAVLSLRPVREQRNWFPAVHDVNDLKVQNLERGDPIA